MASHLTVLVVGTFDTKLDEILYLRSKIVSLSKNECKVQVLDIGRTAKDASSFSHVPQSEIIAPLRDSADTLKDMKRTDYINKAIELATPEVEELIKDGKIAGIIGVGGTTSSSIVTAIMRKALPIGFPKLMVSSLASGDTKPYVEDTDITMMYSVVEITGPNSIVKKVLTNAAGAIIGMAMANNSIQNGTDALNLASGKKIAITMYEVTSPCVDNIRKILTSSPHDVSAYEIYIFHATGSGGQALERLISEGQIDAVVDLTTTEIADELFGGTRSAGPARMEAAAKKGIPMIVSVGACDMVNFGPKETVPGSLKERNLYQHSPEVTLMRTNKEENVKIANFITSKLKSHVNDPKSVRIVLPKGGVSILDHAKVEKPSTSSAPPSAQTRPSSDPVKGSNGEPWHDPEADTALFETIMHDLSGSKVEVFEYPDNINDESFAVSICEHLLEVMGIDPRKYRLANARRRQWSFDHGPSIDKLRRRNSVEVPDA